MIFLKAKKDFLFGRNIPITIEISNSSYNFINHEWSIIANYFLNEEDIILNKVKFELSKYIVNKGATLSKEKIDQLVHDYLENPELEIQPVFSKTIKLSYIPEENKEYPIIFDQLNSLRTFLLNIIQANSSLLEVHPNTLEIIADDKICEKITTKINNIIDTVTNGD